MKTDIAGIIQSDYLGQLSTLKPVSEATISKITAQCPNISEQYLEFLRQVGVGTTTREMYLYLPQSISTITDHPSFQIYNSKSLGKLFGLRVKAPIFPEDAVIIADSGAAWRYCLRLSKPDIVFVASMLGPAFEIEAPDFFTFVRETLILGPES